MDTTATAAIKQTVFILHFIFRLVLSYIIIITMSVQFPENLTSHQFYSEISEQENKCKCCSVIYLSVFVLNTCNDPLMTGSMMVF